MPPVFGAEATPVRESFITPSTPEHEIDSVASWSAGDGRTWLIATAKETHQLVVYDGDTGQPLRGFGRRGDKPGQFNRPNGLAVHGDLLFVAERDNHRVQVLRLPGFEPVAMIGAEQLRSPYGLWLNETTPGKLEMLVTDSFMADYRIELVPPLEELDQRVKRYRLTLGTNGIDAVEYAGHFGDTTEEGALRMVESIAGDPAHDRLLIAEEDVRVGTTLRVYDLAGNYTHRSLPRERFKAQAEGVALWACDDGSGYWITTDQNSDLTVFHVFSRRELGYLGSFTGETVALTDGIGLHQGPTARFPQGVLYVAHNDEGAAAFDWRDIAKALDLRTECSAD
ncbi:phytase [Arenimonas daejeonensis]|uniref:phytase n=1 Tax=Arenimonas daejeonensis TaxID=370777 RepID=UPI001D15A7AD|nr:phytase [Arenimonas daejeonensis]